MSSPAAALAPWPRRRWSFLIVLVFAVQIGLIFLLGDKSPLRPRPLGAVPGFRLASPAATELLALSDPTLFALPHLQGFSGPAWLRGPEQKFPAFDWSEEPRWLALPLQQLGEAFDRFMRTNTPGPGLALAEPEPELTLPAASPTALLRGRSELRLEGGLAQRRLITQVELPSWSNTDVLTNTVVRLVVDTSGQTISATLLRFSGHEEADKFALNRASRARFNAVGADGPPRAVKPSAQLTWGEMIFEWHTLPVPPTNAPPAVVAP